MSDKPGTFKKGDARINRSGRPRDFNAFRELAIQIAHEKATKNGDVIVVDGHALTVSESILRSWSTSKDPRLVQAFVAYCFGKVPDKIEGAGALGEHLIKFDWGDKPSE